MKSQYSGCRGGQSGLRSSARRETGVVHTLRMDDWCIKRTWICAIRHESDGKKNAGKKYLKEKSQCQFHMMEIRREETLSEG